MPRIHFQILPPIDRSHEPVFILLADAEAVPLGWEPPFHVGEADLSQAGPLRFRIVRGDRHVVEVDAFGRHVGERIHEAWLDNTVECVVADWEDRYAGCLECVRVPSIRLSCERDLVVWVPPSYSIDRSLQYPLVFGFDGWKLFDATTSPSGVDWAMDEWIGILSRCGVLPECIVAGLVPAGGLSGDGVPARDVELSQERDGELLSRFVVEEVIPFLDRRYRTIPKSGSRTVVGAGLGGLRAFWTAMGYPDVFSRAACLSTSFEDVSQSVPDRSRNLIAVEEGMFPPTDGRFYFDYGEEGLDECYGIYHTILSGLLREKGWISGRHMEIRRVPGTHSDLSWRQRIGDALRWLTR